MPSVMIQNDEPTAGRLAFAASLASSAGQRLLAIRASGRWTDPRTMGDVGDQAADAFLQGALLGRYPADGILSEETRDEPSRLQKQHVWIVDPLDGTKEYAGGRHDWAVHVGLAIAGRPVLGAVALPAIGRLFVASLEADSAVELHADGGADESAGSGEWPATIVSEHERSADAPLRLVVSRSHTPDWVEAFAKSMGSVELVPCGSVGFKVSMLLFGKADAYVHKVGLKEWDTCAPEVVARACGYTVCRFDGSQHRYNQPDPRNGEIVVCRPGLQERVLRALHEVGA